MSKPALYHFARGLLITLEVFSVLAFILLAGGIALMLRLKEGPLRVDFLTSRAERAFAEYQNGFTFDITRTDVVWGGDFDPFLLSMSDITVARTDGTPVIVIPRLTVTLSKRALLLGRLRPREIMLSGAGLGLTRTLDGQLSLKVGSGQNLGNPAAIESAWEDTAEKPALPNNYTSTFSKETLAKSLAETKQRGSKDLLGGLSRIQIKDAAVLYEDHQMGVKWRFNQTEMIFARKRQGLVADVVFKAGFAVEDTAAKDADAAIVRLRLDHDWQAAATRADLFFSGVRPDVIAAGTDKLADLASIKLPFKGRVAMIFDRDLTARNFAYMIGAESGEASFRDFFAKPLPIKGLIAGGNGDISTGRLTVDKLRVNFGGAQLAASARLEAKEGQQHMALQAELLAMPMDELRHYWTPKLAPDAQGWVTTNLSKGIADKATLDIALMRDGTTGSVVIEKLGGVIDFHDISVDYFPPLPKVTGVDGQATYDANNFNLKITSGALQDMAVSKSDIKISNLKAATSPDDHAKIAIDVTLAGPLKTALGVLDSEPLKYPTQLGLLSKDIGGQANVDVSFAFPLTKALEIENVAVKADASVADASLPDLVAGQTLAGGPYRVVLDKGRLSVDGSGTFGGAPIKLGWTKDFDDGAKQAMTLKATLTAAPQQLTAFGVPAAMKVEGFLPLEVGYIEQQDGKGTLDLKGDLTPLAFAIDALSYTKTTGAPGTLSLTAALEKQDITAITAINLTAPDLTLQGKAGFDASGLNSASFSNFKFGQTDAAVEIVKSAGYDIRLTGAQVDASSFFEETTTTPTDEEAAARVTPLTVTMQVDRLLTGANKKLEAVRFHLKQNEFQRIEQLEMDATAGGQPLVLRYMPVLPSGKSLKFEAQNAGAALDALGLTSAVQGGRIKVEGQPNLQGGGPRDLLGSAVLADFRLRDAPVLAKLLNAMSLSGLTDLLKNKGVAFKKARVRFSWSDKGQPTSPQNMRLIQLSDGQTSGSSLGLTFEGSIDNWRNIYDLNGTIIPVSDINKVIGKIPVLGDVLTAGGEGFIAATYKVEGPKSDPKVSVNTLAVLAPGVLRKLFFED